MVYPHREYYISYLLNVENLAKSSVKHYLEALTWISKYLVKKGLIEESLFEVLSVATLEQFKDILLSDEGFTSMDKRGHQMYSVGFNHYLRFAKGEKLDQVGKEVKILDIPVKVPLQAEKNEKKEWTRSEIIRDQAIKLASYECEINAKHKTFIAAHTGMPYMEGHHSIPMKHQGVFPISIDVYANIVCVCPICHRLLHFGRKEDKLPALSKIYYDRADRMAHSGITLSRDEFIDLVL